MNPPARPSPVALAPQRHQTSSGVRIYALTLPVIQGLTVHSYLVVDGDYTALIDTGTSLPESRAALEAGFAEVARQERGLDWAGLNRIVVTHAHFDHFGGLGWVRRRTSAPVAVHALNRPVLEDPAGSLEDENRRIAALMREAGVPDDWTRRQIYVPQSSAPGLAPVKVDTVLQGGERLDGRFEVIHAPGHGQGQVCLHLDDVFLSADQALARTNPRLVPRTFEAACGLDAYLTSLSELERREGIRLALAGHDEPLGEDAFRQRIVCIRAGHLSRLEQVLAAAGKPRSGFELAEEIYGDSLHPALLTLQIQSVATWTEHLCVAGRLIRLEGDVTRFLRCH